MDGWLDSAMTGLAAISIEGAKGVGKTATALRRARSAWRLDSPDDRASLHAEPRRILDADPPTLLDEWQMVPTVWDIVRRAVDDGAGAGSFLLTGSSVPSDGPVHSGAGRIVVARMRPMSLFERGMHVPAVSMRDLLSGSRPDPGGARCSVAVDDYVEQIVASGLPGIRGLPLELREDALDSYLRHVVERDFSQLGQTVRRPDTLRRWMTAYAAASSTTASWESIRDAATAGEADKPAKKSSLAYRDALARLWLLDEIPAWLPTNNRLAGLGQASKHQLADPALSARLLGVDARSLLGDPAVGGRGFGDARLLGQLFESLVTLDVLVYAQAARGRVHHLRSHGGQREVDLIVEHRARRVLAIEVKLGSQPDDHDVRHLRWLGEQIGDDLIDSVVITSGSVAYRRDDGILVLPAALLGP